MRASLSPRRLLGATLVVAMATMAGPVAALADDTAPTEPPAADTTAPPATSAEPVDESSVPTTPPAPSEPTGAPVDTDDVPSPDAPAEAAAAVAPVAVDDAATIDANHVATVAVLANDTVPEGTTLQLWNGTSAVPSMTNLSGTWTVSGTNVVHTPPDGRTGPRSVQYVLTAPDGSTSIATVTVQVNYVAPPVVFGDQATTPYETPITIDVLANDFGGTGTTSGVRYPIVPSTLGLAPTSSGTAPTVPSVTTEQGTWTVVDGQIRFEPADGFWGNASMGYRFRTSIRQLSPRGSVSIYVTPTVSAQDDEAGGVQGSTVTVPVTLNDFTPPRTTLDRVMLVGSNGNGAVTVVQPGVGTWTYSGLDVVFTPEASFVGTATVTYRVVNSSYSTDDATVTVTIDPSVITTTPDAARITFKDVARLDVTANDTATGNPIDPALTRLIGPDGSLVESYTLARQGTWSITDGVVTFAPVRNFRGTAQTEYVAANGQTTATGTVAVTVTTPGQL